MANGAFSRIIDILKSNINEMTKDIGFGSSCKEQSCNKKIQGNHYLCRAHWKKEQEGKINKCPQCGVYKDVRYRFCINCNDYSKRVSTLPKRKKTRRYDRRITSPKDDPKAKDKRQLFHDQRGKCIYCGNEYPYDKLQIEHMIPKVRGGQDSIRNAQLACRRCNQSKGTMTDIEFREKHATFLPQEERTPANPPINPELLRG